MALSIDKTIAEQYHSILREIEYLELEFRIIESRSLNLGFDLPYLPTEEAICKIHKEENAELISHSKNVFEIAGKKRYFFRICQHNVYTPLSKEEFTLGTIKNHCLHC
ncbi:MAG: hypothetical protein INQ03_07505 [Candidatus Heimdallarchaeota archaeon]|nr:hypothetical protein [Candidatus Heimdallarchaeota archaeon]